MISILTMFIMIPLVALWARRIHDAGGSAKILGFPVVYGVLLVLNHGVLHWVEDFLNVLIVIWLGIMYAYSVMPSKFKDNKFANVKLNEHHNKFWIDAVYVLWAIQITMFANTYITLY